MLTPCRMSVKIISVRTAIWSAVLAVGLCGCSPTGPGALLKGKKYLDRGDYAAAVAELQTATTLLATNAAAWNYYGVALQGTGQADDAVNAYQRALELDRDLLEARLNLGTLFLQQNKPADAKAEFTAYTLRRPNDPDGWLKLGSAQLRLEQTVPAERSFSAVLSLKTDEAEAYNGLGLARIQRNRPADAAQFFSAALRLRPDFAAALLNLATVYDQYLHDKKSALQYYRAYLALTPKPADWDQVNALVNNLEQSAAIATTAPAPVTTPAPAARPAEPAPAPTVAVAETRSQPRPVPVRTPVPRTRTETPPRPVVANPPTTRPAAMPTQTVQVTPEPRIVSQPGETTAAAKPTEPPLEVSAAAPAAKPGLWSRLFGSSDKDNSRPANTDQTGVTPLPDDGGKVNANQARTVPIIAPALVNFPRYHFQSPARPVAGDRRAASGVFSQARKAEQEENWDAALNAYYTAARLDPSWFEAQFNTGVIAQRLQNYSVALPSYEKALALQPESLDARYNFALALKSAGYVPDAVKELKMILAAHPDSVRAHLALANLCAQSLHDPVQAREHYRKVLELDPKNPRASDIRFWLGSNPE